MIDQHDGIDRVILMNNPIFAPMRQEDRQLLQHYLQKGHDQGIIET